MAGISISSNEIMKKLGISGGAEVIEAINIFYSAMNSLCTENYHPPDKIELERIGITE